jgi:hypothetical protein
MSSEVQIEVLRGPAYRSVADFKAARKSCSSPRVDWFSINRLAVDYHHAAVAVRGSSKTRDANDLAMASSINYVSLIA